MKQNFKSIYSIVFLGVLFVLAGCERSDNPCSGPLPTYKQTLGTANLDPSFREWMNAPSGIVWFKNAGGDRLEFFSTKAFAATHEELLKSGPDTMTCKRHMDFYGKYENDFVDFTTSSAPFEMSLGRALPLDYDGFLNYRDSGYKPSEFVRFRFLYMDRTKYSDCKFLLSDTTSSFRANYSLLDSTYSNVYVCENKEAPDGIYPTRFVLQKGKGLIGFELSNNEVWVVTN